MKRPGRAGRPDASWAAVAWARINADSTAQMAQVWPTMFPTRAAAWAAVNKATAKGMLEGERGHLRLTDKARNALGGEA